jgi:PAS domain S-box-containing protein
MQVNAEDRSQVRQALLSRRDAIADSWYKAVTKTSYVPLDEAQVREHFVALTEEVIALLLAEPLEHAQAVGASLPDLHYVEPEALGRTQEVLARQLVEGLTADRVAELQPRLTALLGGLATGFLQQAREIILTEQEKARSALTTALGQAQEALQKAYGEVEQQVRERTAELRATNESLQREIFERKQAEEKIKQRNRELATLNAIAAKVSQSLDLGEVLSDALDNVLETMELEAGVIRLLDEHSGTLDLKVHRGVDLSPQVVESISRIKFADMSLANVITTGTPLVVDVSANPIVELIDRRDLKSLAVIPLQSKGRVLGTMEVVTPNLHRFTSEELQLLTSIGHQIGVALENARLYQEAQRELAARRRVEGALRESEERFRGIFENAAIGLYRTTPDGHILMANPALVRMFGYSSFEELAQRNLEEEGYEPEYPRSAFKQRIESEGEVIGLESAWVRHDGITLFVRESARAVRDEAGNTLYYEGSVEDITERKLAEQALRKAHDELETRVQERTVELAKANEALLAEIAERKRAEEELIRLSSAVKMSVDSIVIIDVEGKIIDVNEAALKMYGTDDKEGLIGQNVLAFIAPEHRERGRAGMEFVLEKGYDMSRGYEVITKDSNRTPVELSATAMKDADGKPSGIVIIARDITERKQADERIRTYRERLRSLASELSLTEERERRRLATALHDRIAQTLALSKIKLGVVRGSVSSTDLAESLDEIYKLIEQVIQDTRSLTFEISSPILYELGLAAAVDWLTEQTQKQHGILSEFWDDKQPKPLDEDVQVLLYQAVRELLINVVKHAQAQHVKVSMRRDDTQMRIAVEDNGVGFDSSGISSPWSKAEGFGLFSIRERLDTIGGRLEIESQLGNGTRVTLVAPLAGEHGAGNRDQLTDPGAAPAGNAARLAKPPEDRLGSTLPRSSAVAS